MFTFFFAFELGPIFRQLDQISKAIHSSYLTSGDPQPALIRLLREAFM